MHLALPVPVGIPRPFMLTVVHRQMPAPRPPDLREATRFVAGHSGGGPRCFFHQRLDRRLLRIFYHRQADLSRFTSYYSHHRCAVIVQGAAALALISSPLKRLKTAWQVGQR